MDQKSSPTPYWNLYLPAVVLLIMGVWMGILRSSIAFWVLLATSLPLGLWLSARRYPTILSYESRTAPRSGQRLFIFDWMILIAIYIVIAWLDRQILFPNGRLFVDAIYGAVFGYYLGIFSWPIWLYLRPRTY